MWRGYNWGLMHSPCLCPTSSSMGSSSTIVNVLFFSYSSSSMIFTFSSFLRVDKSRKKESKESKGVWTNWLISLINKLNVKQLLFKTKLSRAMQSFNNPPAFACSWLLWAGVYPSCFCDILSHCFLQKKKKKVFQIERGSPVWVIPEMFEGIEFWDLTGRFQDFDFPFLKSRRG